MARANLERLVRKDIRFSDDGVLAFFDPKILGAVAASQQTFFIVSGSPSNIMLGGGDQNTMLGM